MELGVAYIITNREGAKHRTIFEELCNRSINYARKHLSLPVAVLSIASKGNVNADIEIDGNDYLNQHTKGEECHGLIAAELLKTHICEWSPFDRTLYIDCDAFVLSHHAIDYLKVLEHGYDMSLTTCISMAWKDCLYDSPVKQHIFGNDVPQCFPYWNFGVFGCAKSSNDLMTRIREHFLTYCFSGKRHFMGGGGAIPHAQPSVVRAAFDLSPNHKIFTMPARFNAHLALAGGYVFSGTPVVLHLWKDTRGLMLSS